MSDVPPTVFTPSLRQLSDDEFQAAHTPDTCPWCLDLGYADGGHPHPYDSRPACDWYECERGHLYIVPRPHV